MTVGRPPRLARWLLGLLVPRDQLRDTEGELAERFGQRCMSGGRSAAVRWYWWQVVRVVPLAGRRFWESTAERCRAWLTGGWSGDVRAVCRTAWRRPGYPLAVVLMSRRLLK